MKTVDSLLPAIANDIGKIKNHIPAKDKRILLSLAKQSSSGTFLTENQANLLVKILKENIVVMKTVYTDVEEVVDQNKWTKTFRAIKKIRKIYIAPDFSETFVVEFSFNTRLKEKMHLINAGVRGNILSSGAKNVITLNEENLFLVLSTFAKDGFEIDEKLKEFYREICEIKKSVDHPLEIFTTKNEKLKQAVINELTAIEPENALMLQDRKIRYQYEISANLGKKSLAEKIAQRTDRRVFANSEEIDFGALVDAFDELARWPVLIVFDGHHPEKDKKTVKMLAQALAGKAAADNVGIYFRYDGEADTVKFNQEIAALHFNKPLDDCTLVAGISNSKIPKFMIKSGWKPRAVISITNNFRSNKASVYFSDVDLIIYYTSTQPLGESIYAIM